MVDLCSAVSVDQLFSYGKACIVSIQVYVFRGICNDSWPALIGIGHRWGAGGQGTSHPESPFYASGVRGSEREVSGHPVVPITRILVFPSHHSQTTYLSSRHVISCQYYRSFPHVISQYNATTHHLILYNMPPISLYRRFHITNISLLPL